jgi:hypothetical protein
VLRFQHHRLTEMLELLAVVQVLEIGRDAAVVVLVREVVIQVPLVEAEMVVPQEARRRAQMSKQAAALLWVGLVDRVVHYFTPNLEGLLVVLLLQVPLPVESRFTVAPVVVVVVELLQATPTSAARVGATVTPT